MSDDAELPGRMQMLLREVEAFEPNLNWIEEEEPSISVRRSYLSASDAFLEDAPSVLGAGQHSINVHMEVVEKCRETNFGNPRGSDESD